LRIGLRASRDEIAAVITGPLFATTLMNQYPPEAQRECIRFWVDCLERYSAVDIRAAFVKFAKSGGKFPQPADIAKIISAIWLEENSGILDRVQRGN